MIDAPHGRSAMSRRLQRLQVGLFSPHLPLTVLVATLVIRWILVTGLGDFPGDYDFASRLVAGQWQGRDFYMAYTSVLSWYSTALLLKVLGGLYVAVHAAVWLWWTVAVAGTVWMLRTLRIRPADQALGGAGVGLLMVPPNTNFVVMNFFAAGLSGPALALFFRALWRPSRSDMLMAGLLLGVAAVAKPNAGGGVFGGMLLALAMAYGLRLLPRPQVAAAAAILSAGFAVGFAVPLLVLGYFGGYSEIVREVFLSAGPTKGTPGQWLLRTVPRISLAIDSPYRYLIELAVVMPVAVIVTVLSWRLVKTPHDLLGRRSASGSGTVRQLWALSVTVLALSVWSLIPAQFPHTLVRLSRQMGMITLPEFNNHLLYVVTYAGLATYLIFILTSYRRAGRALSVAARMSSPAAVMLGVIALVTLMAIGLGGRYGSVYAAPLFVPAFLAIVDFDRRPGTRRALVAGLILWTLAWQIAPTWRSTFSVLAPLPKESIFRGLYWPNGGAGVPGGYPQFHSSHTIEALHEQLVPRLGGATLLWMITGLSDAFGGKIYRPGLLPFNPGHPLRNEIRIARALHKDPPDFILTPGLELSMWDRSDRAQPDSPFRAAILGPWLKANYNVIWIMRENPVPWVLWQRRSK